MQPTRQKFTEYLSSYQFKLNDTDEEVSYKVLDCAYDLFCALEALANNHKTLEAKYKAEQEKREDLQRAIRLYGIDRLSKKRAIDKSKTEFLERRPNAINI